MRPPVMLILLALVFAAPAAGFFEDRSLYGDLDGDGTPETVRTVRVLADPATGPDDEADRVKVNVADTCPNDTTVTGVEDGVGFMRLVEADTRAGRELSVDLRSGASARAGEYRLMAWRLDPAGCGTRRDLFRYLSEKPTRRPKGTMGAVSFGTKVKELERRYRGKELVLIEGWVRRGDSFCCPSVMKRSYYRYDPVRDRYARYKTKLQTLRDPGGAEIEDEPGGEVSP